MLASPYGAACSLQSGCGTARYVPRREDEADDGHPAGEHVDELRQLIERGTAQEVAHAGNARIVLRRWVTTLSFSITFMERNFHTMIGLPSMP